MRITEPWPPSFLTSLCRCPPALARSSSGVSATVVNLETRSSCPLLYSTWWEDSTESRSSSPAFVKTSTRSSTEATLSGNTHLWQVCEASHIDANVRSPRECQALLNMNKHELTSSLQPSHEAGLLLTVILPIVHKNAEDERGQVICSWPQSQ